MSSDFAPNATNEALNDLTDYYMILEVKPHASPSEIREAYLRAKSTYQKDNVALYTLIDANEREDMLRRIEEAYQVLSNPDRRREYDRFCGQIAGSNSSQALPSSMAPSTSADAAASSNLSSGFGSSMGPHMGKDAAKIISIDRSAPMESFGLHENPLEPPRTDIRPSSAEPANPIHSPNSPSAFQSYESSISRPSSSGMVTSSPKTENIISAELEKEIAEQTEWSGAFLRRVREVRGISIEEVTQATKITKPYILAIEEENYSKLPAAVFIRGFVGQLARLLKLPQQQVTTGYMSRLQRSNPEKFR
jgi:curved DNA-binding protein CbpA